MIMDGKKMVRESTLTLMYFCMSIKRYMVIERKAINVESDAAVSPIKLIRRRFTTILITAQ